jgi:hypothetical protein
MKGIFIVVAIVAAFASAGFWLWSALLKPVYPMGYLSEPPKEVVDRIRLQAWLNAIAAALTGLSAALQGWILVISN